VAVVQTHISAVLLTPRYVFKFKRPVDLGFANFRRLSQRRRFCKAEVRLNRRLAEGVYLDVLPLWSRGDGFSLKGGERLVDYCVVMRRLPAEDMLDQRLRRGRVSPGDVEALARLLVDFHRRPSRKRGLAHFGSEAVIRENWEENFRQTEPYLGQAIEPADFRAIREAVEGFLRRNAALIQARAEGGFVRDGHGDLRCEHVYLGAEGIKVIDCIEFNERFRYGDVANDLAFLLMDLTALGRPELSRALLERYVALSAERTLLRLVPFYACYRAFVRGKVACFRLDDPRLSAAQRAEAARRTGLFFKLALAFAREMEPPLLLLVGGLMGTGKSALAQALAGRTGLAHFNSDELRKAMARAEGLQGRDAAFGGGIYTPAWNERTYEALLRQGRGALVEGRSVILDASFSTRARRQAAVALGESLGARVLFLECRLGEEETLTRLRKRECRGASVSDGRAALYPSQNAAYEPPTELAPEQHLAVETDRPPSVLAEALLADRRLRIPPPLFSFTE
jgi:hypothetical protein